MTHKHAVGDKVYTHKGRGIVLKAETGLCRGLRSVYCVETIDGEHHWMMDETMQAESPLVKLAEAAE